MHKKHLWYLLFILFVIFCVPSIICAKMVSVVGENVNLRSGPGKNYSVKWKYGSGFPLRIVKRQGDWLQVEDFENDTGWLHKKLTSSKAHMIVKVNKDKNKKINIRSGPGTKHPIVGKAYYGVVFRTLNQKEGWARVKHDSGLEGWIRRDLLWGF